MPCAFNRTTNKHARHYTVRPQPFASINMHFLFILLINKRSHVNTCACVWNLSIYPCVRCCTYAFAPNNTNKSKCHLINALTVHTLIWCVSRTYTHTRAVAVNCYMKRSINISLYLCRNLSALGAARSTQRWLCSYPTNNNTYSCAFLFKLAHATRLARICFADRHNEDVEDEDAG